MLDDNLRYMQYAIREAECALEVGEVTSSWRSPLAGPIALAFVRSAHSEDGTALLAAGRPVRVAPLPFAGPKAPLS